MESWGRLRLCPSFPKSLNATWRFERQRLQTTTLLFRRSAHTRKKTSKDTTTKDTHHLRLPKKDFRSVTNSPSRRFPGALPSIMTSSVEIATVPTADTPGTCIFLRNDATSYVFGRIAEGTQRGFQNRQMSVGSSNIFLTGSVDWNQQGGLVGFLLTSAASITAAIKEREQANENRAKRNLKPLAVMKPAVTNIHGGDNTSHTIAVARSFVFRQPMSVELYESRDDPRAKAPLQTEPDWQDNHIKVWKIPAGRNYCSSPSKRSHDEAEDRGQGSEAQAEQVQALSDPRLAQFFAKQVLFNIEPDSSSVLIKTKAQQVQEEDIVFLEKGGSFEIYDTTTHGPLDDARTVFVFPKAWDPKFQDMPRVYLKTARLPKTTYSQTSMSYIVKTQDRRGKFNRAAAEALGVPVKQFKLLIEGQSVEGKDGQTITPEMVLGETMPGNGFIVADILSRDFLDSFMARPEWNNNELMTNIACMYWILGPNLATDPQVTQFIKEHPKIRHIFCAPDTCPNMITNPRWSDVQLQLHRIDPERYLIPEYDNRTTADAPAPDLNITFGRAGLKMHLMPKLSYDDSSVSPFVDLVQSSEAVDPEVLEMAEKAKVKVQDPAFLAQIEESEKDIPNRDAEILCLGTGSACPSKYRNVSGTLISVPGIGSYLFDCGEGTLGQLRRGGGEQYCIDVLRDLKGLIVSHLHADHHIGVIGLLKSWYEQTLRDGRNVKLAVCCNGRYRQMLEEYSQVEDFGFHRLWFPSCDQTSAPDRPLVTEADFEEKDSGIKAIKRIPVVHCYRSMATEVELTSGLRIAYSGDAPYSPQFAEACKGTHLLIHECTFGDGMEASAAAKAHSTISQALDIAEKMEASRTVLTHFSQRYARSGGFWPQMDDQGSKRTFIMATDLMRVKLGDFQKAACFAPAVQKHLAAINDENE